MRTDGEQFSCLSSGQTQEANEEHHGLECQAENKQEGKVGDRERKRDKRWGGLDKHLP